MKAKALSLLRLIRQLELQYSPLFSENTTINDVNNFRDEVTCASFQVDLYDLSEKLWKIYDESYGAPTINEQILKYSAAFHDYCQYEDGLSIYHLFEILLNVTEEAIKDIEQL